MIRTVVVVFALLAVGCASLETKQKRAKDMAEMGLVSHPELGDIMATIARLEAKYDTLLTKMNVVEEAHRDDTEMVLGKMRELIDELKAELRRRP